MRKQIDSRGLTFSKLRDEDMYYVDKSLLIKDILDTNKGMGVHLFTRPRRFGKTTNLSMLDAFFNMNYKGNTWFDDLEISKHPEYGKYKNAFPMIRIDLKKTKVSSYDIYVERVRSVIRGAFAEHRYLMSSDIIEPEQKRMYQDAIDQVVNEARLVDCIPMLCELLEKYHGIKPIILIDEYDRAVSDAFGTDSHRPMMDLLGDFMGEMLKGNEHLQMAVVTGVMQIAKESIFSGLNNLNVNNVFSEISDERYGFTETEVKQIIADYGGTDDEFKIAKEWYDGYRFGNAEIYNPWSIMYYVSKKFKPEPYWVNSGGDWIVKKLIRRVDKDDLDEIISLTTGGTAVASLIQSLPYDDLRDDNDTLYSLMAMTGYIKAVPYKGGMFTISMPNREVSGILGRLASSVTPVNSNKFKAFSLAIIEEDAGRMTSVLREILLTGSYLKLTDETSYELVIATLLIPLSDVYKVRIEREEGNGRVDIILIPEKKGFPPMIFELKTASSEKDLDRELDVAFEQIHDRKYYMEMKGRVILIAMAFHGKIPKVRIDTIDGPCKGRVRTVYRWFGYLTLKRSAVQGASLASPNH